MKERKIRASTCCFAIHDDLGAKHPATLEFNLGQAEKHLKTAGEFKSDIMLLPEFFAIKGLKHWFMRNRAREIGKLAERAEIGKIPAGRSLRLIARYAKKYRMYVIATVLEKADDGNYNTAVIIDRNGKVFGKYRKTHLPDGEEKYAKPGVDLPVFKTDFGVIAVCVCFDLNFIEVPRVFMLKGAEILFWPTMWGSREPNEQYLDLYLRATALMNNMFVVSANYAKPHPSSAFKAGRSAIIAPTGYLLADTEFLPGFATAECRLERVYKPRGGGVHHAEYEFRRGQIIKRRRPELYRMITG